MIRGTTPTLTFKLPFDCSDIDILNISFAQYNTVVLEKDFYDCDIKGKEISVTLTEDDTLKFDCGEHAEIQIRVGIGEQRLASQIMKMSVDRVLKDGILQ